MQLSGDGVVGCNGSFSGSFSAGELVVAGSNLGKEFFFWFSVVFVPMICSIAYFAVCDIVSTFWNISQH